MSFRRGAGSLFIPGPDRVDDGLMLTTDNRDTLFIGQGCGPKQHQGVGHRPGRLNEKAIAASPVKPLVKLLVDGRRLRAVRQASGNPRIKGVKPIDLRHDSVPCGKLCRCPLKHQTHLIELHHFGIAQSANDRADPRAVFNDSIGLQPAHRLSDRCPREGQPFRDLGLAQTIPGRILARSDRRNQRLIRRLALGKRVLVLVCHRTFDVISRLYPLEYKVEYLEARQMSKQVIVVGSGNAALCAGIAALEQGAQVLMLEKADEGLAGGNTKYTAGAMRFAYDGTSDLLPLLKDPTDPRLNRTDFGSYPASKFTEDLLRFNGGRSLSPEQTRLIEHSLPTLQWLATHGVTFEPIWNRQSFEKDGQIVFWGGLTLAAENEGVGLFEMERAAFLRLGGEISYGAGVTGLVGNGQRVAGVRIGDQALNADAVILACGGFEASKELRRKWMGGNWEKAKVRGTPHNTGDGLAMAREIGAKAYGLYDGCHATPMDLHMADFGGLHLPPRERKSYRKICYFLGVMLNADGKRFVDEGKDFRNYTYAQFGRAVLDQPGHFAWQVFDAKVAPLLYDEYRFREAHFVEADSLERLCDKLEGVDASSALTTLEDFNNAVDRATPFDPTILDGKSARGLDIPRSNWAQVLDTPPFRAYPVTGGITFTYGGLAVSDRAAVLNRGNTEIPGLYACGEMVGGVFFEGYPGGSGLTSGAVFGRLAGTHTAE